MSFTLEIEGGNNFKCSLSTSCLGQIERLSKLNVAQEAIVVIFGTPEAEDGTRRVVEKQVLLKATEILIPLAKELPGSFQVRIPNIQGSGTKDGGVGAAIQLNGKHYLLMCMDDFWTLETIDEFREGKLSERHYDPTEIKTDTQGIVIVEAKPRKYAELTKILMDIRKFLTKEKAEELTVIWG